MSLNRSDSLSSYHSSNDLFTIGKPSTPKDDLLLSEQIPGQQSFPKDTIEFSREKIKEEALHRLRQPAKYLISQPGFLRIGKYLFMTISLPPYLLLYGLPKWVIVQALPLLLTQTVWLLNLGKQKVKTPIQNVIVKLMKMFEKSKKLGRNLIQPLFRLGFDIRNGFQRKMEQLTKFFEQIGEKIKELPREFISSGSKKIKNLKNNLIKKMDYGFQGLQQGIKKIIQAPNTLLERVKNPFEKINIKGTNWGVRLGDRYQSFYKQSQHNADKIVGHLKRGMGVFQKKLKPFNLMFHKHFLPAWVKVKEGFQSLSRKLKDFFQHKQKQSRGLLVNKRIALKKISYQKILDKLFSNRFFNTLPSKMQIVFKRVLLHKVVCSTCEKIIDGFKNLGEFTLRFLIYLFEVIERVSRHMARYFSKINEYWKRGKIEFKKRLFQVEDFIRKWTKKGAYFLLLFLVMAGILLIFGLSQLGESLDQLVGRYLFKQQRD